MSAIGATAGQSLFSFLQSLSGSQTQNSSSATGGVGSNSDAGAVGGHHHHHKGSSVFSQIQQAVTTALQSQGSSSTDPNTTVENAIASVLKNALNGSSTATPATAGSTSATGTQDTFSQLLQANGITSQQFQQDFLNAIQSLKNGSANPQSALQNLSTGLAVNTTA